jgi:4a-hydroxytetrahydrobiopterin dehydratase
MAAQSLSASEIANLADIPPAWQRSEGKPGRTFTFADFSEAFAFVARVALVAESLGSPPRVEQCLESGHHFPHHP